MVEVQLQTTDLSLPVSSFNPPAAFTPSKNAAGYYVLSSSLRLYADHLLLSYPDIRVTGVTDGGTDTNGWFCTVILSGYTVNVDPVIIIQR